MRNILMLVIVLFAIETNAQEIKFESEVIVYGKIKKDSDGTRFFKFKNVGDAPLNVRNALASSSNFIAVSPKEPVFPGETGKIKVNYPTDRSGTFSKVVRVHSNAKNKPVIMLTIKGYVYE